MSSSTTSDDVAVAVAVDGPTCVTRKGWGMRYSEPDSIPPDIDLAFSFSFCCFKFRVVEQM